MAKMTIRVSLDLDLDGYRAEYGGEDLTREEIRERIAYDLRETLQGAPWADAIRKVEAK